MNSRRAITVVYVLLLSGLGLVAGAVLYETHAELSHLKQVEATNRRKLAAAEAQLREQERILERLRTDPEYVEKAIRERLLYARPGDVIYRFKD